MSSLNPLVSILITCYNADYCIESALDNLLNQTYPYIEIIVVNDGSNDNTAKIIQEKSKLDQRVNLINRNRIGRAKALNDGLKHCKGKYIAINDADDISLNQRIEKQVYWMENHPETGLLGTSKIVHENGMDILDKVIESDSEIRKFFLIGQPIQHSSVMVRKDIMDRIGGYNEKIPFLLDRDLFIRIAAISKLHQLNEHLIILDRSEKQFFKNKYTGMTRINLHTRMQIKAIQELGFGPIHYLPVFAKYFWSLILQIKN